MKILKLEFKNINNLKGEHCVDFTLQPLADADIFAITGATGSGKSTLLDVITIALFNRTPRFSRLSKKELVETGSIITRNEKDAFAKITYEAKGMKYISKWEISYNRNNNLNDYHMEIITNNGILDLKKSAVPQKNEEIIGLDYEQFTKAIILSQGEFSKFLKANNDERSLLLERITGTSIYRDLGKRAHEVCRDKRNEVEVLQGKLEAFRLLDKEELKELNSTRKANKENLKKNKEVLVVKTNLVEQKLKVLSAQKKIELLSKQKIVNSKEIEGFATQLAKWSIHKKVVPFRKELQDYNKVSDLVKANTANLKNYKLVLEKQVLHNKDLLRELKEITKEEINQDNFLQKCNVFENKVIDLDNKLAKCAADGKVLKVDVQTLASSKYINQYEYSVKTGVDTIKTHLKTIEQNLSKFNYSLNSDFNKLEEDKKALENLIQDYKDLNNYKAQVVQITKELTLASKNVVEFDKELKEIPKTLEPLENNLKNAILELENVELKIKVASFEEHRKELVEGKECALCGSLEHPFAGVKVDGQKLSELRNSAKIKLDKLKKDIASVETNDKLLKQKIASQKELIVSYNEKLVRLKESLKNSLHNPKLLDEVVALDIDKVLVEKQNSKTTIDSLIKLLQEVEPLEQLLIKLPLLAQVVVSYKELSSKKKTLYPKNDITLVLEKLCRDFNETKSNIVVQTNKILQEEKQLSVNKKDFSDLKNSIEKVKEKTNIISLDELQNSILSDALLSDIETKDKTLQEQKTSLEALHKKELEELSTLKEKEVELLDLKELEKSLVELKTNNDNFIGSIAKIDEQLESNDKTIKLKKDFMVSFDKKYKEFIRWDNLRRLVGDGTGKKFSTFAQALTLKNLISYTNKRLKSFSGRYLIYPAEETQELMILDTLQGNTERSVKTLSGGETFLVSLAMALSLSDMASKNVKLESLFIDEGFATLDGDTLESAIDLLEKLQSESNKKVGVISHVQELKDRIDTQIILNKNSQGFSKIEVVG